MSGLEFNGSYKKIPSFDFSTEFYGLASKVWVLMKAMEPKGKRLNVKFKKKKKQQKTPTLLSICPMPGSMVEVFYTHVPSTSYWHYGNGVFKFPELI